MCVFQSLPCPKFGIERLEKARPTCKLSAGVSVLCPAHIGRAAVQHSIKKMENSPLFALSCIVLLLLHCV